MVFGMMAELNNDEGARQYDCRARGSEGEIDIISAQHSVRTRELCEARGERDNAARDLEEANAALQTAAAIEDQLVEKAVQLSEANEEIYLREEAR